MTNDVNKAISNAKFIRDSLHLGCKRLRWYVSHLADFDDIVRVLEHLNDENKKMKAEIYKRTKSEQRNENYIRCLKSQIERLEKNAD